MTYGHLQADCLYTGISSGPNARYRVWEAFTFTFTFTFTLSVCSGVHSSDGGITMRLVTSCQVTVTDTHGIGLHDR